MSTESFLLRLQHYDREAWARFVADWTPNLYTYLSYNVLTQQAVEELVIETLQSLVQFIQTCDGDQALSTFVYATVYRKVADYWRRPRSPIDPLAGINPTAPTSISSELAEVLASLPEQAQQVLFLRYHLGLEVAEIAEVLGRSYKATESLLSRARRQAAEGSISLSDQELVALFSTKAPRLSLPDDFLEKVQQQVLAQLSLI